MELFNYNHLAFIGIATDGLLYFAFYKITVSQMNKQSLSTEALSKPGPKNKKALFKMTGLTLLVAFVAFTFIYFLMTLLSFIPSLFDLIMPYIFTIYQGEEVSYVYIFITAVIFAPIVEEVVFRGYLFSKWADKYGVTKGIWFSSIVFMIIHLQSLFIPQLILGLLCAIIYAKYKNLFYPIFVHAIYNFFVILPAMLTPEPNAMDVYFEMMELRNLVNELPGEYILLSVLFVIGLLAFIIFSKRIIRSIPMNHSPYTDNMSTHFDHSIDEFENIEF